MRKYLEHQYILLENTPGWEYVYMAVQEATDWTWSSIIFNMALVYHREGNGPNSAYKAIFVSPLEILMSICSITVKSLLLESLLILLNKCLSGEQSGCVCFTYAPLSLATCPLALMLFHP